MAGGQGNYYDHLDTIERLNVKEVLRKFSNSIWETLRVRLNKSVDFIMIPSIDNNIVFLNDSNTAQIVESSGKT